MEWAQGTQSQQAIPFVSFFILIVLRLTSLSPPKHPDLHPETEGLSHRGELCPCPKFGVLMCKQQEEINSNKMTGLEITFDSEDLGVPVLPKITGS
jgi:hypothetical protein